MDLAESVVQKVVRCLPKAVRKRIFERIKDRFRYRPYFSAVSGRSANLKSLTNRMKISYRTVDVPLVLISQVERSGGSMMAQLFDGHPEVLAHPHELKIGYPNKRNWPPTDIADLDEQFRVLFELNNIGFFESGYTKGRHNSYRMNFFLLPQLQRELFRVALTKSGRASPRDVLNAYFTSYFNAWLNLRARIDQAKLVSGFTPMMAVTPENMDRFWEAYPDGYLISSIRSPLSWHPSFVRLKSDSAELTNVKATAARWNSSVEAMFRERERKPDRVMALRFEDLVTDTEAAMRVICGRIGLDFHPALVTPTFNGEPIASNSLFAATEPGVMNQTPAQRESLLSDEERSHLTEHCMPLYERAMRELVETV
jgi:hypothetical protein